MKKKIQQKLLDTNYQKIRSCLMLAIFKWYGKLLLIPKVVTNTAYVCCMLIQSKYSFWKRYHNTWDLGVVLHKLCLKG